MCAEKHWQANRPYGSFNSARYVPASILAGVLGSNELICIWQGIVWPEPRTGKSYKALLENTLRRRKDIDKTQSVTKGVPFGEGQLPRPITQLLKGAVQCYVRVRAREAATQSIMENLLEESDDDSVPEGEMTRESQPVRSPVSQSERNSMAAERKS